MKSQYPGSVLANIQNWQELAAQPTYRVEYLARLCNVSTTTLERFFNKRRQTSPQRWLDQVRQFQAELLINAGQRTKEIANALGYENPSDFCHQFKRSHGVFAKQWRSRATEPVGTIGLAHPSAVSGQLVAHRQSFVIATPGVSVTNAK